MSSRIISKLEDLGPGKHWLILMQKSYQSDGGYPESGSSTYDYIQIECFNSAPDWEQRIHELTVGAARSYYPKQFKPAIIEIPEVKVSIQVKIGT